MGGDHRLGAVDADHAVPEPLEIAREPALPAAEVQRSPPRRRHELDEDVAVEAPVAVEAGLARPRDPAGSVRVPGCGEIDRAEARSLRHSGGALLGDRVQPLADLVLRRADVVEPRQLREALEPEHALEERRRAVADRAAGGIVTAGLGD